MGVLNVTPDSFSDGGRFLDQAAAFLRIDQMLAEGADLIDIGGESSRPGAEPVAADEQWRRIEPALKYALRKGAAVSVDTASSEVARRALDQGAHLINDATCLSDPKLAGVVAAAGASLIIMHCREPMHRMPGFSRYPESAYGDVVADVLREWFFARERALEAGMPAADVWFDPGIGFTKSANHSFEILRRLQEFSVVSVPIVLGFSRKSFISSIDQSGPDRRLGGSIAAALLAVERGAQVLRVHDVQEHRQALLVAKAGGFSRTKEAGARV